MRNEELVDAICVMLKQLNDEDIKRLYQITMKYFIKKSGELVS